MKDQFIKSLSFIPGLLLVPAVYLASRLLPQASDEYAYDCDPRNHQPMAESEQRATAQKVLVTHR